MVESSLAELSRWESVEHTIAFSEFSYFSVYKALTRPELPWLLRSAEMKWVHSEWYSHRFLLIYEHAVSNGVSLGHPKLHVYGTFVSGPSFLECMGEH